MDSDDLWMCTTCYTCEERCPRGVKIVDIIIALRNIASEEGHMLDDHKKVSNSLLKNGHTIPLSDKYAQLRKDMGLPEKPPTLLSDDEALKNFQAIMSKVGFDKLIGGE